MTLCAGGLLAGPTWFFGQPHRPRGRPRAHWGLHAPKNFSLPNTCGPFPSEGVVIIIIIIFFIIIIISIIIIIIIIAFFGTGAIRPPRQLFRTPVPLHLAEQLEPSARECGSKVVAKVIRSKLVGPLAAEAARASIGQYHEGASRFRRMPCRVHLKGAARTRRPAAVLFTDLAGAFYYALPELALGAIPSSRKRAQVFDALGIAHEQSARLEELIRSEDTTIKRQEVGGVLAQHVGGLPQGAVVLGIGIAETSSHVCWHSAEGSPGGSGVCAGLSGVSREPGALSHAGRGDCSSTSAMWCHLWDDAGGTAVPDVDGRFGHLAGGGFVSGATGEAGDGHGGNGSHRVGFRPSDQSGTWQRRW